jgi:hypothetical protein
VITSTAPVIPAPSVIARTSPAIFGMRVAIIFPHPTVSRNNDDYNELVESHPTRCSGGCSLKSRTRPPQLLIQSPTVLSHSLGSRLPVSSILTWQKS